MHGFITLSDATSYDKTAYYIAINIKWLKMGDKSRVTSMQISLDIGTLTWYVQSKAAAKLPRAKHAYR